MSRHLSQINSVLMIHNRYLNRGGEDETFDAEVNLLRSKGLNVIEYLEDNRKINQIGVLAASKRTIWSSETFYKIKTILTDNKVDIIHVHNYFPLISPSIFDIAYNLYIPVVHTLHNYRLLCLNGLLFRNGGICEDCVGSFIPWSGIYHKCYRDSRLASTVVATMLTYHRLIKTWDSRIDRYITFTDFARDKMIEGGLPPNKIIVKPNFIYPDPGIGRKRDNYALFVGRLSTEKGVKVLLKAWNKLSDILPLWIVGDGPLLGEVSSAATNNQGIRYLGRRQVSEVLDLMGRARFLVFPSLCYEGGTPKVIIEAFSKGTPVISSKMGVMESMVNQSTGLLFSPGNGEDLVEKIKIILSQPGLEAIMHRETRLEFERKYSAESNFEQIIKIYNEVRSFHRNGK